MRENCKDPAIKLFGQKIPFPGEAEDHFIAGDDSPLPPSETAVMEVEEEEREVFETETESEEDKEIGDKDPLGKKVIEKKKEVDHPPNAAETKNNNNSSIQNPNIPSIEEKTAKSKNAKSENEQQSDPTTTTTNSSQEKTLKKPDKLLPCPRCKSMETKFCYYNNYNVNQPRYFCKACQRYWTAGGTMRNVPVGSGRRKNKNCSSHYRHITISEALQKASIGAPNGTIHHHIPCLKSNGRVLSFGNEFHSIEETKIPSKGENVDKNSSLSSITVSNSMEESARNASKESLPQRNNGFVHQVQSMSSCPWSYPWSSAVPMSFYHSPFWNVPWFPSHPYGPNPMSPSSGGSNSPTLGKHSRDADDDDVVKEDDVQKEDSPRKRNGCVLVPKTLRIDDPNEAAKSSIWATLGIKNEYMSKGGMINAFQSKKSEKNHVVQTSPMLMANPAALSRSLNFHENS